jgi:hypothetical protein
MPIKCTVTVIAVTVIAIYILDSSRAIAVIESIVAVTYKIGKNARGLPTIPGEIRG